MSRRVFLSSTGVAMGETCAVNRPTTRAGFRRKLNKLTVSQAVGASQTHDLDSIPRSIEAVLDSFLVAATPGSFHVGKRIPKQANIRRAK